MMYIVGRVSMTQVRVGRGGVGEDVKDGVLRGEFRREKLMRGESVPHGCSTGFGRLVIYAFTSSSLLDKSFCIVFRKMHCKYGKTKRSYDKVRIGTVAYLLYIMY